MFELQHSINNHKPEEDVKSQEEDSVDEDFDLEYEKNDDDDYDNQSDKMGYSDN